MGQAPVESSPQVDVPSMLNVAVEYVDGAVAAGHGDRPAYISDTERVTFAELQRRVNRVGNTLIALGVEIEQRVAILLPNRSEFVTSFFGAIKIGAVPAAISYAVTPDEQSFLLADSRARAIITTPAFWAPLRERRSQFPFLRHVVLVGDGAAHPGEHDFRKLVDSAPTRLEAVPTAAEDAACWLHTSGSTGTPKWAMHLQRDTLYSERLYAAPFVALRPDDVIVCGSPCFHAYPLGFTTYFALKAGATVVLNSERSTPARMFHLIREHRATVFVGVPTLYAQMLQAVSTGNLRISPASACASRPRSPCPPTCTAAGASASASKSWMASARRRRSISSSATAQVKRARGARADPCPGTGSAWLMTAAPTCPPERSETCSSAAAACSRATGGGRKRQSGFCKASGTTPETSTARTPTATTGTWAAPTTCCG